MGAGHDVASRSGLGNTARALFFERFSKFCRLIRFDKRGTGLSDRPVKMATLEERTDDIRAVMDDIGIECANIFGVSEGGSMACLFAATYPQRVNSLLVWGAQARWIASPDHPWGQTQEEHDRMVAMIDDDWPSFEYITGPGAGVGKDADPAFIESLSRYMRAAANPSAVHAYEQMNGQIDTRPILPSIQAPALVMNRTGDPCANVEAARDMASRIPGAKFKEYPGNSHSMMLDDMETVLSDIQEFITGERPIDSSDRILATVLFLDIASSTGRAAELGDTPWRNLLNSSYAIVRKELARFRGKETNTTGDGFSRRSTVRRERCVAPRDCARGQTTRYRGACGSAYRRMRVDGRQCRRHRGPHRRAHYGQGRPRRRACLRNR